MQLIIGQIKGTYGAYVFWDKLSAIDARNIVLLY